MAQAELDRLNAGTLEYNRKCAPLVYRMSDRAAVLRALKAGK